MQRQKSEDDSAMRAWAALLVLVCSVGVRALCQPVLVCTGTVVDDHGDVVCPVLRLDNFGLPDRTLRAASGRTVPAGAMPKAGSK
jgi:hypothetical protein